MIPRKSPFKLLPLHHPPPSLLFSFVYRDKFYVLCCLFFLYVCVCFEIVCAILYVKKQKYKQDETSRPIPTNLCRLDKVMRIFQLSKTIKF